MSLQDVIEERLQDKIEWLEGILARFKAGCKITGKGPVDQDCEMVVLLKSELDAANHDYAELMKERADYVDENKRLAEFARFVIRQECWSIFEQDGGDIQELAEKLGLIVPCVATEEDIDDDCDCEVGDTIFKFSQVLKGDQP